MALDFIAGCFGGCAGILVGHPLDTIKIRIQTQDLNRPQYKGTLDCLRTIIRHESFSGLYKGMSSPLAGIAIINALVFGVYGNLHKNLPHTESLTSHFIAGTVAGLVQSFICSPMELAKTQVQVQKEKVFKSPLHCLSHIGRSQGLRGVFRGLDVTLLREGFGFGVYFAVYEWLSKNESGRPAGTAQMLAAGGFSGAACWLCTYPLDVVKSRIQADGISGKRLYKNSMDCLVKSTKSEGISFLFRGLSPTLIRAFPTNAATWAVFTWIMRAARADPKPEIVEKNFLEDFTFSTNSYFYDFDFIYNSYVKYLTHDSSKYQQYLMYCNCRD